MSRWCPLCPQTVQCCTSSHPGLHSLFLQVLLCLYCFLAGVAVSTGRLLWLLPLATAAAATLHWAAGAVSQLALPFYKDLPAERAALWCVDATHLAYSSVTGGQGLGLVDYALGVWQTAAWLCHVPVHCARHKHTV